MKQSLWSIVAAFSFALMAVFVRLGASDLGAWQLVFLRSIFGMLFIGSYVFFTHRSIRTRYFTQHMIRSFLGIVAIVMWFWALPRMNFGLCITLVYTTPLFMALNFFILAIVRKEPPPWHLIIPIVIGFVGIEVITQPTISEEEIVPALMCILSAAIDLLVYWQMKRMGDLGEPSWRIVFYFAFLGAVIAGGASLFDFKLPTHPMGWGNIGAILGMGLFATLGQLSSTRAYAYGNMLLSSCLGFSSIVFSIILGAIVFHEPILWSSVVGGSLVIIGGVMSVIKTKKLQGA